MFLLALILCVIPLERENVICSDKVAELAGQAQYSVDYKDMPGLLDKIQELRQISVSEQDMYARFYAIYYYGNYYYYIREYSQALERFNESLEIADRLADGRLQALVYDDLGVYYLDHESDYNRALSLMYDGLEATSQPKDEDLHALILAHVAGTMFLKGDVAGIKYAVECYHSGHNIGDKLLTYLGAYYGACLYYLDGQYEEALKLVNEAISINKEQKAVDANSGLFSLYANIMHKEGQDAVAAEYYTKAISEIDSYATFSTILTYLSYGSYLYDKKRYGEAITNLKKGVDVADMRSSDYFRTYLYKKLSRCYAERVDFAQAYLYLEKYCSLALDNIVSNNEIYIKELKVKYDTQKSISDVANAKVLLLQKERMIIIISAIHMVVLFIAVVFLILYHRKNLSYRKMIQQIQADRKSKYQKSSLSGKKGDELFERIENILKVDGKYKDLGMNLDRLCELVGSNRSYVSQIINEKTSLSYNAYVNSLRVEEAVRILSDEEADVPMKSLASELGFNSVSTFSKAFQSIVKMPPTVFYKHVKEMRKD